jgi:hypothetical protein
LLQVGDQSIEIAELGFCQQSIDQRRRGLCLDLSKDALKRPTEIKLLE